MTEQLELFNEALPVCPACSYAPADETLPAGEIPQNASPREMARYIGVTTYGQALDFFEVLGANDGFVFCPNCGHEVNLTTGDVFNPGDDFDGILVG